MNFKLAHSNLSVFDLEKSLKFYKEALNLHPIHEIAPEDGSFKFVYLSDGESDHQFQLTWKRERTEPYAPGENETHIAFCAADFDAAYQKHKEMGCIRYENAMTGVYFITDPDGYWLEIMPSK